MFEWGQCDLSLEAMSRSVLPSHVTMATTGFFRDL